MPETTVRDLELGGGTGGFRLESLELFNWGTFTRTVWRFPVGGKNALVTGEIGSGKSTLVDALTTLLLPPQKITYNKAAGAERRERTVRGYVLGEYKSSRDGDGSHARPVHLRGEDSYSVVVAVFRDARAGRLVSLAGVFWLRGGEVQRLNVVSGRPLSVLEDFSGFRGDAAAFRKALRATQSTEVFDSFTDYAASFRSSMGIAGKALDLFYQTVSMKSVGDLDDFVRNRMLEGAPVEERIATLLANYDNLRAAHDMVERTRLKREALRPIATDGREHESLSASIEDLRGMMDHLPFYVLDLAVPLLEAETVRLAREMAETREDVGKADGAMAAERERETGIQAAIEGSEAGRRIAEMDREMDRLVAERDRRRERMGAYADLAKAAGYARPDDADAFRENRTRCETDLAACPGERERIVAERDDVQADLREARTSEKVLAEEIASLKRRTTSIPARNLALRSVLTDALGLGEKELPFAGELIRVRESERAWEGAAERILRGFGLSLLVPEPLYRRVGDFVTKTDLKDRLVFFRVPAESPAPARPRTGSLVETLEVKADSPMRPWLESEILRRFDFLRCARMEDFYRETDAVTMGGLVKSGRIRHEKDDRPSVSDPRSFILGWSNKDKLALLEKDLSGVRKRLSASEKRLAAADTALDLHDRRRDTLSKLSVFTSWEEIDWRGTAALYDALKREREKLEKSSDQLARLRESLTAAQTALRRLGVKRDGLLQRLGSLERERSDRSDRLESARTNLAALDAPLRERFFPPIEEFLDGDRPDLAALDGGWQEGVKRRMETRRESTLRKEREVRSSFVKRTQEFISRFPENSAELSASVEFIRDFIALLEHIERDDLPTYEERFHALLRESTLNDIALFQQQLENDSMEIRASIDEINGSLRAIEYGPGTYLMLSADRREDQDVRDFRADLRRCLENTSRDEDLYSEAKFLQVKKLLDRFAGGESADRSWTEHVTDVRSWHVFTASERYMEDGSEKEFYSSSSGKSGGQKEKLAYTILASALSHQYGLGRRRGMGGFRLVAIDEAFGRGSEESTRYGLELFGKLDLQLLVITPLQKISVIENHVATVHFIANPEGKASESRSLTIEEYLREKGERRALEAEADAGA